MTGDIAGAADATIVAIVDAMDVDDVGERIGAHAVEVVRDLGDRGDEDLELETVRAAISNVRAVLLGFRNGEPPGVAVPPDETLAWVSTLVHRGVGAAAIPRCYAVGQALCDLALRDAIWSQTMSPEEKWDLAGRASQHLFAYVEKITGDLIEHYERERDRWVRGADSIRTEIVLEMVEGRPFDAAHASATLRYELDRPHVALLIWNDPEAQELAPPARMKKAAAELARSFGGTDLLVLPAGAAVVWAWTTGAKLTDRPETPLMQDRALLAAAGSIGHGADGFIRSHGEAREARRMAGVLSPRPGSVVRHEAVALSALLTRDMTAAAQFVERELGPLSEDDDTARRLRATLTVLFEEGMGWGKAAKRLGVHQNTVIYRARQAEEMLGRPLVERRLELETALRLADGPLAKANC